MLHKESSLQIYFTSEYARFKMMNGNRQLNEKKINKIIDEISNGNDMLRYYPIQVFENGDRLDILDGQHRFFISRKLNRPVYYILVSANKTMADIAKINSNVEKWKAEDFINCYVQFENKNYTILQQFMDKYGFSLGVSMKLLSSGISGDDCGDIDTADDFRKGKFEVRQLDKANEFAEICKQFNSFSSWKSRTFMVAIQKIMDAGLYDIKDLIADFNKRPELLVKQANPKLYIYCLEQLVNVGKHKRVILSSI